MQKFGARAYSDNFDIDTDIKIRFVSSGHIINAYQCELWVTNNNHTAKIAITSDLGNIAIQQEYVDEFKPIEKANLLIGEATYSDPNRKVTKKDRKKDLEKLESVLSLVNEYKRGRILIPVFALQRTQVMLTYLYELFKNDDNFTLPIILDSTLGLKINQVFLHELKGEQKQKFQEVLSWKNLKIFKEFTETEEWLASNKPAIFLSSSGMLTAGRSVYTASKLMPNQDDFIIMCGYAVEGSLGWKLKQKKTTFI